MDLLNLFWFTGASCDGCTISVLGDTTVVPIEALLRGEVEGLPRIELLHTLLAPQTGEQFLELVRRAAGGEMDPYGVVMESSVPKLLAAGSYGWMGEEQGKLVHMGEWLSRLAPRALFIIAVGDCGVFGGPHSGEAIYGGPQADEPHEINPSGATGAEGHLGAEYRSTLGLPVIHLPGCSVPPVFIATLVSILRWAQHQGPMPELDELGRPDFYEESSDVLPPLADRV